MTIILGIDLGTTSVKITFLNNTNHEIILSSTSPTSATKLSQDSCVYEQCPSIIFKTLEELLGLVDKRILNSVEHIGICCQMHGIVFWNAPSSGKEMAMSNLITWEDQRCDGAFLKRLPPSRIRINSGFGCATIFWYLENNAEFLRKWTYAGTIADLLIAKLCGFKDVTMSPQNAASWGYFDVNTMSWETDILAKTEFPLNLLPKISLLGEAIGSTNTSKFDIPMGAKVYPALGDLQASVFACVQYQERKAVVNVGTSSQFALLLPSSTPTTLSCVPYFENLHLAVAASLNGGNVLSHFVRVLQEWTSDLGASPPDTPDLWERLSVLAEEADGVEEAWLPHIRPTIFGERHFTTQIGAEVKRLRSGPGMHLGAVYRALCCGLIKNLKEMAQETVEPVEVLGTGSALVKNRTLKEAFLKTFEKWNPRMVADEPDASYGTALYVAHSHCSLT